MVLSPRAFPSRDRTAFEASLFFERSSCIRQPSSETRQKLPEPPIHRNLRTPQPPFLYLWAELKEMEIHSPYLRPHRRQEPFHFGRILMPVFLSPPLLCLRAVFKHPTRKEPCRSRRSLPSSRRRLATLSNLNLRCLKSAVPEEACSLLALFPRSFSLSRAPSPLPPSPPSLFP